MEARIKKISIYDIGVFIVDIDFFQDGKTLYAQQYTLNIDQDISELNPQIAADLDLFIQQQEKAKTLELSIGQTVDLSNVERNF